MPTQIELKSCHVVKFYFALPFLSLLVLFLVLELTHLDLWISLHFYNAELHQWTYKESWLAETVLHIGGRSFVYACLSGVLICLSLSFRSNSTFHGYRHELFFLLIASISGPLVILLLKNSTHIYCPWKLSLFGGNKPYVQLFDYVGNSLEIGHCFPSAHAGSGFSFISLYFFLMVVKPKYKWHGLFLGLALGLVYGVSQQMRGAHFLSHDLVSLGVCWFSSLAVFVLFFRKQLEWV